MTMNGEYERVPLEALIAGTADTPFQLRALVPWITREAISAVDTTALADRIKPMDIVGGIEFISVFSLVLAFRRYLSLFITDTTASAVLSFLLFYILPFNFLFDYFYYPAFYYPYDMPSMLFFTLGLILLYREKWTPYYLLFIIATFNRETTCFLTMIYLVTAVGKNRPKTIALHCFAQFAVWAGIKLYLGYLYRNNPGAGFFENQWEGNYVFFFKEDLLKSMPYFFRTLGYLWIPIIILNHLIKDRFVRRSLLVLIPFFVGMFFVGALHELRVWGEMIPVVLAAFILVVKELLTRNQDDVHNRTGSSKGQGRLCGT